MNTQIVSKQIKKSVKKIKLESPTVYLRDRRLMEMVRAIPLQ